MQLIDLISEWFVDRNWHMVQDQVVKYPPGRRYSDYFKDNQVIMIDQLRNQSKFSLNFRYKRYAGIISSHILIEVETTLDFSNQTSFPKLEEWLKDCEKLPID